jgi:hypothetical protein
MDSTDSRKALKFKEMSTTRLVNAKKQVDLIGKLGKSSVCEFTKQEAEIIIKELHDAVEQTSRQLGLTNLNFLNNSHLDEDHESYSEFEMAEMVDDVDDNLDRDLVNNDNQKSNKSGAIDNPFLYDVPLTYQQGAINLSRKERLFMLSNFDGQPKIGVQIGSAIEALMDVENPCEQTKLAENLLLNLMRS